MVFQFKTPLERDPLSALTWWITRRRAYNYKRYQGYTYSRRKGKRRRVHHFKEVFVPALLEWKVYFPPQEIVQRKAPQRRWVKVPTYIDRLKKEIDDEIIIVDPIYRIKDVPQEHSWIRQQDKLVWERPQDPDESKTVVIIRVWVLFYDEKDDEHKILSRTRAYGLRASFYQAQMPLKGKHPGKFDDSPDSSERLHALKDDLYDQFKDWADRRDYVAERGLIAWTFWYALTFAPPSMKKGKHPEEKKG